MKAAGTAMWRRRVMWAVMCAAVWGGAVRAAPAAEAEASCQVQVWVILASNDGKVSPELRSLASVLKRQFRYSGYALKGRSSRQIAVGKAETFGLTGPYALAVKPTKIEGKKVTLEVQVLKREGRGGRGKVRVQARMTVALQKGADQLIGVGKVGESYLIAAVGPR